MAIKRVKLNYVSVMPYIKPVEKIPVSSSCMEELDRAIRQKIRQNEAERAASIEFAGRYNVR